MTLSDSEIVIWAVFGVLHARQMGHPGCIGRCNKLCFALWAGDMSIGVLRGRGSRAPGPFSSSNVTSTPVMGSLCATSFGSTSQSSTLCAPPAPPGPSALASEDPPSCLGEGGLTGKASDAIMKIMVPADQNPEYSHRQQTNSWGSTAA